MSSDRSSTRQRPSGQLGTFAAVGTSMIVLVAACDEAARDKPAQQPDNACHLAVAARARPSWREDTFDQHFTRVSSLTLSAIGDSGFASVRTIDMSRPGSYLIVDSRNRNIKVIDTAGRLVRVIGREGIGPGEFRAPYDAAYLERGDLAVLDPENERVSFFDSTGTFLSSFNPIGQDARRIVADEADGIAIAGLADARSGDWVVVRYDRAGRRRSTHIKADPFLFEIELIVDQPWLTRAPDGAILSGLTVTPAIHRVAGEGTHCVAAVPTAWQQLRPLAPGQQTSLAAKRAWIEGASLVENAAVLPDGRVALVYGVPGPDAVRRLALYDTELAPVADLTGVPGRLVGSHGSDLMFVREEEADRVTIERYRALVGVPVP